MQNRKYGGSISRPVALGYIVVSSVAFIVIAALERMRKFDRSNKRLTKKVQKVRTPPLNVAMAVPTMIGKSPQVYVMAAGLMFALYREKKTWDAVIAGYALAMAIMLGAVVRNIVDMPRPARRTVFVSQRQKSPSYPSGHTMLFTGFLGYYGYLAWSDMPASRARRLAMLGIAALLVMTGFSRVYRGEHWTSDVIGGYILGSEILVSAVYLRGKGMSTNVDERQLSQG